MSWLRFQWILRTLCCTLAFTPTSDAVTVKTRSGSIKGSTETVNGTQIDTYLGIPFAEPPVDFLRFRAPVPLSNWTGVKVAQTLPNSCIQPSRLSFANYSFMEMWNLNTNISEDCLYLNIWVPKATNGKKLATIVWIHGGSFVFGSSTLDVYNGKTLAAKKSVIVASINYRVGVIGFLYSGTEEAPGNMELLDQQMAIKWVHDNIEAFGGDKNKITLLGESAGSASVSHHLLASSSWPYFNNGIMLSDTSLAHWAWEKPAYLLNKLNSLADVMECDDSKEQLLECLRKADAETIEAKQWELDNIDIGTFSPVIDGNFLEDEPQKLLSSGKVKNADIILGNTKDEGEFFLISFFQDVIKPENILNLKALKRAEYKDLARRTGPFREGIELESIIHTYEGSVLPSKRSTYMDILDDIFGDYWFKCPVHDFATQFSDLDPQKSHAYMYSFEYRHSANPWPAWMGVLHAYDIEIAFGQPFDLSLNYNDEDRTVSENMMEYFTSFAKTGSPNSQGTVQEWPEYTAEQEQHLVFSQDTSVSVRADFRHKECSFWKDFFPLLGPWQGRLDNSACHGKRYCTLLK